jgi:Tfp pilus assembly protein FimT
LIELITVVAILSFVTAVSVPSLISYRRSAALRAAAEQLAAGLNNGRQLAISQAQRVCVQVANNQYRYLLTGCGGAPWTGPGTGANGFFSMENNIGLTTNANPVFDYLGAANPGAALTVTNPQDGTSLSVVVSVAGRVRICPAGGCPP